MTRLGCGVVREWLHARAIYIEGDPLTSDRLMRSLWQPNARALLLRRAWVVLAYRHVDHHFRQFGV